MGHDTHRPATVDSIDRKAKPSRAAFRATSAIVLATLALAQGWTGTGHAWTVQVNTPTIRIVQPNIVVQPNVAVPDLSGVTTATQNAVASVQAQAAAVAATVTNLPAIPQIATGEIAAQVAAAADSVTQSVTAATTQATASLSGQGLAALINPGLAAAHTIQVRTDVVTLASGATHTVDFYGDGLINFSVEAPAAGAITIGSAEASRIVDNVVNLDGVAQSQALTVRAGQLALVAELAPSAGPATVAVREPAQRSPLVTILTDPSFRAGDYDAIGLGAGAPGNRGSGGTLRSVWDNAAPTFFATVEALTGAGSEEQQAQAETAISVLNHLETLVSKDRLAPADVCQAAGGGGVGLPGCGTTEAFGAEVTLAPEATGDGCALLSAGGGVQLSCGGPLESLPALPGEPDGDSLQTLQDLLDMWLQQPAVPDGPIVAGLAQPFDQVASLAGARPAAY